MYHEGSCFELNSIINEIKVSSLKAVPSLGEAGILSRQAHPSGNEGIVWILTEQIHLYPYLLLIALAHHFRIWSRFVVALTVSYDSRDSTGHSNELCEHPQAVHVVENAG